MVAEEGAAGCLCKGESGAWVDGDHLVHRLSLPSTTLVAMEICPACRSSGKALGARSIVLSVVAAAACGRAHPRGAASWAFFGRWLGVTSGHQLFQIVLSGLKLRRLCVHFHLPIRRPPQGKGLARSIQAPRVNSL